MKNFNKCLHVLKIAPVYIFLAVMINFGGMYIMVPSIGEDLMLQFIYLFYAISLVFLYSFLLNRFFTFDRLDDLHTKIHFLSTPAFYFWMGFSILLPISTIALIGIIGGGSIVFHDASMLTALCTSFAASLYPGVVEEICFRWFLYGKLKSLMNKYVACLISGIAFGLCHINQTNDYLSMLLLLVATVVISYVLAGIYEKAKSIYACIIFHVIWDMFVLHEGLIINTPASSVDYNNIAVATVTIASENIYINGGQFGIESSIIAIAVYAIIAVWLWRGAESRQR